MTHAVPILLAVGIWFIVMDVIAMNTRVLYGARRFTRKTAYAGVLLLVLAFFLTWNMALDAAQ